MKKYRNRVKKYQRRMKKYRCCQEKGNGVGSCMFLVLIYNIAISNVHNGFPYQPGLCRLSCQILNARISSSIHPSMA